MDIPHMPTSLNGSMTPNTSAAGQTTVATAGGWTAQSVAPATENAVTSVAQPETLDDVFTSSRKDAVTLSAPNGDTYAQGPNGEVATSKAHQEQDFVSSDGSVGVRFRHVQVSVKPNGDVSVRSDGDRVAASLGKIDKPGTQAVLGKLLDTAAYGHLMNIYRRKSLDDLDFLKSDISPSAAVKLRAVQEADDLRAASALIAQIKGASLAPLAREARRRAELDTIPYIAETEQASRDEASLGRLVTQGDPEDTSTIRVPVSTRTQSIDLTSAMPLAAGAA